MGRLQKLQNRAMRIILGCSRYTPIAHMLDCLNWMTIKQRIYYNTLVIIYKITKKLLPSNLQKKIDSTPRLTVR